MSDKAVKARKKALEKFKRDTESKTVIIYRYLEKNPKTTIYNMKNKLSIPYSTMAKIVRELVEDHIVDVEEKVVNGRVRKLLTVASTRNLSRMLQEEKGVLTPEIKDRVLRDIFEEGEEKLVKKLSGINQK